MSHHTQFDDDDDENEELSSSENDDAFDADIEALRRACMLTNTNSTDLNNTATTATNNHPSPSSSAADAGDGGTTDYDSDSDDDDDDDDDIALVRNIQNRLSLTTDLCEPLTMKPLCTLPPEFSDDEDDEDDSETLRAIQRRFSAFNTGTLKNNTDDILQKPEQVHASNIASENEISNNLFVNRTSASEGFPDSKEACSVTHLLSDNLENQPSGSIEWHESDGCKLSILPLKHSRFPKSAQAFVDAIKKNRSYQKFLRSKLTQIEARIEENKKLRERVKILKDFQVSCKKITGRALSQMKDPRVQLISAEKSQTYKDSEVNDKKLSATHCGPAENSHVANYRLALTKYPHTFQKKKWSEAEKENLGNGIRQQFQEMVLQVSVDQCSGSEGSSGDKNSLDNILASIKDLEITPEKIREFLPRVNWEQLASAYVEGRTGAECEARWLNCEDPLINRNPWTVEEDKNLLFIVQEKGITNWFDIAVLLGTNRTPFQCLVRYQRSLNACILKREWTTVEDEQLRIAVETFGESNWQPVASALKGRTGTQCANRWKKSLHPTRQRVGRWTLDEDKRLKVAVMLFGPKNWRKIAQFVPGRTQVQCRERWVNSLDPSLNFGEWTEEEDFRLKAAIAEHGYCWSKVAACIPSRTDSQCRRRWKVLLPDEVPLLQAARRMQKAALICNFVDRERERPALGPNDFIPLPRIGSVSEPEGVNLSRNCKRKLRGRPEAEKREDTESCNLARKLRSKRPKKKAQTCSEEVLEVTTGGHDAILKKKIKKRCSVKNNFTEPAQDHSSSHSVLTSLMITNGEGVESFVRTNSTYKKKSRKSHSKRSKCIDPDENSQSVVPLPAGSLEMGTTNGDVIEAFSRNNAMPNKKKRARKEHEPVNLNLEGDTEAGDITLACLLSKGSKKRRTTLAKSGSLPCNSQSSNLKDTQVVIANDKEPDGVDMVKGATVADHEPVNLNLEGDTEAGDITLACLLRKGSKKRRTTLAKSGSTGGITESITVTESILPCNSQSRNLKDMQIVIANDKEPGGVDMVKGGTDAHHELVSEPVGVNLEGELEAGDVTLAGFLRNRSKKRQPSLGKSGCNGGIPDNMSPRNSQSSNLKVKEPGMLDMVKGGTVAHHEPVREPVSGSLEGDLEAGDVTLACFLHTGLKKRQPTCSKSGNRSYSSSHVERGSELPSQGLDQLEGCEAVKCCSGGMSENISPCNMQSNDSNDMPTLVTADEGPVKLNMVEGQTVHLHELARESVNINLESVNEAGDMPTDSCSPSPGFEGYICR